MPPPPAPPPHEPTPIDLRELAEVFATLHANLSIDETLERVATAARTLIGAHLAAAHFRADGGEQADEQTDETAGEPPRTVTSSGGAGAAPGAEGLRRVVCSQNRPLRLDRDSLAAHPAWDGTPAELPGNGWLAAPLLDRDGANIGLVELSDKEDGEFTADDEAVLVQLAQLASVAVENANLFHRERATAQQLQRRLLPGRLQQVEGVEVAARYLAGGGDAEVGGDWYDVIDLGRRRVGLVIGDVMGRGVEAASVMGQLRVGLRAYALDQLPPAQVLTRLARLVASLGDEYLVTVAYAIWDLAAGTITFATAGHLPPLLRTAEGTVAYVEGEPGLPIGVAAEADYVEHRLDAPEGATIVLYTDGLVEHRDVPLDDAMGALRRAAGDPVVVEELVERVLDSSADPDAPDDIAVLVAHRPGGEARSGLRPEEALTIAAEPSEVGRARRWLVDTVSAWSGEAPVDSLSLLASEVITNAVLHAGTPVTITVERHDDALRVCVTDQQAVVPSIAEFTADRSGGRGMGLIDAIADGWGVDVASQGKTVWFELSLDDE